MRTKRKRKKNPVPLTNKLTEETFVVRLKCYPWWTLNCIDENIK